MPDPLVYLTAMSAAMIVAALLAPITRKAQQRPLWVVVALSAGVLSGYYLLRLRINFPPVNALDRWLTIVLPMALLVEVLAALPSTPRKLVWALRILLTAISGRILLHGSGYLAGDISGWPEWKLGAALVFCAGISMLVWWLLLKLARRSPPGHSLSLALAMTLQSAGIVIMLGGYVSGGAAAFPLNASIFGLTLILAISKHEAAAEAPVSLAVVGLSSLLFIGRFFGGISTTTALVLLTSPLLCWVAALPVLQKQPRWIQGAMQLLAMAIPLTVILTLAKLDFDRHTAPLLSQNTIPATAR